MTDCGFDTLTRDIRGLWVAHCQCGYKSFASRQRHYAMRDWSNHFAEMTEHVLVRDVDAKGGLL